MKQVLVLYYSQSGNAARIASVFAERLRSARVDVCQQQILPVEEYPYPWRGLRRLFSVFPECFVGPAPAIHPLGLSPQSRFDLVVLVYQVWHLAPSLPIQGFLQSDYAKVLQGTPLVTACVSRHMWQSASETMKGLLARAGARHRDNIVVTQPGPPWSTFLTVPRALLSGKRDRLLGLFPRAEVSEADLVRVTQYAEVVAERLTGPNPDAAGPWLQGLGAVHVQRRYIVPELVGWYGYRAWARLVAAAGRWGKPWRHLAMSLFIVYILTAIVVVLPIAVVASALLYPLVRQRLDRYAARLAEPSGL